MTKQNLEDLKKISESGLFNLQYGRELCTMAHVDEVKTLYSEWEKQKAFKISDYKKQRNEFLSGVPASPDKIQQARNTWEHELADLYINLAMYFESSKEGKELVTKRIERFKEKSEINENGKSSLIIDED